MFPSEILAFGTAVCSALSAMLSSEMARHLNVFTLTRWRQISAAVILAVVATALGGWSTLALWHVEYLALSGLAGIVFADTALNDALYRLGPRNAALVFSLNAPIAAVMGYFVLGETLRMQQIGGMALVITGIALAVVFGQPRRPGPSDAAHPSMRGLIVCLLAAVGQAAGTLISRPVMADHVDPVAAMAVRAGIAAVFFIAIMPLPWAALKSTAIFSWRHFSIAALSAVFGTALGMSLFMAALARGNVAIVATLAAMSPVAVLPMVWVRTGKAPPALSWLGAAIAMAGIALIFIV